MGCVFWSPYNLLDRTAFINNKGGAVQSHVFASIEVLLAPHAVLFYNGVLWVREQGKRKGELRGKLCMARGIVRANANDRITGGQKGGVVIPQVAGLDRTGRCVVFGIKVEDDFRALESCQGY